MIGGFNREIQQMTPRTKIIRYAQHERIRQSCKDILAAIILVLCFAAPVAAGPFEDAVIAHHRGDYATALRQFRSLAGQGNADAQTMLGAIYSTGQGVAVNYAEAMRWYRLAANQGDAFTQAMLGMMYYNGHGAAKDYAEAAKWSRKAADQGNAIAQNNLGALYVAGRSVPQNYGEAAKWFRKAADQGNADAQARLGTMYATDNGIPKDDAEAAKWFRKAADQGHARSQLILGIDYSQGTGVPQDYVLAYPQDGQGALGRHVLSLMPRGNEKPSFDCAKAKTAAARLICADGELARLDAELGIAFQKRKTQISAPDQSKFVADHLAWIRDRNTRCKLDGNNGTAIEVLAGAKPCMVNAIRERIAFLAQADSVAAPAAAPAQEPIAILPPASLAPHPGAPDTSPSVAGSLTTRSEQEQEAFHRCVAQTIREAVGEALRKNGETALDRDKKGIVGEVLFECPVPTEVLLSDRAQLDAWMAQAAVKIEAQIKKDAPRIKIEKGEEDRVGADYYLCLQHSAKLLALTSDEPADIIVQAAFPACSAERNTVFETYRRYNDTLQPSVMRTTENEFFKRLRLDVIVTRAQRQVPHPPPTSQPKPQQTPI